MAHGKPRRLISLVLVVLATGAAGWHALSDPAARSQVASLALATPAMAATSSELFAPIATVLRDPRCMNCHPRDERPRQGDDRHPHAQNVVRGVDDLGFVNMRCNACHREDNNPDGTVPGAPMWHLAPLAMGWQGLNDADLCTALKDEKRNGGRKISALIEHMDKDKLVLWGWAPGGNRTPVATPHDKFVTQLKDWAAANAPCPG